MSKYFNIPEPFQFNPLKHLLAFSREFVSDWSEGNSPDNTFLMKELKHIGTSVMDIYTGSLSTDNLVKEISDYLNSNKLSGHEAFSEWTGIKHNDFRIIALSDSSQWTLKYHNDEFRYVHFFPARESAHTLRVKANTLKSALLYLIIIGKDYISEPDLNRARALAGLSPIKDPEDAAAITEMIEMIRN